MSTQAASIRLLCDDFSSFSKNSSSVSFFRPSPNHRGSPVSRLLITIMNFWLFPRYSSSTPICFKAGFRRDPAHRSRQRRSIARTVLVGIRNCFATWIAEAPSHAPPTASSKRLLNGALLGSCTTFSTRGPQSGQRNRHNSTITVALYSLHGRSRISRWSTSWIVPTCLPQPEQIRFLVPAFRLTHSLSVLAFSLISC